MRQSEKTARGTIFSPFQRLNTLLEGEEPGQDVIDLAIGGPRHPMPDFVAGILSEADREYGQYPSIYGMDGLRQAIAEWCERRYPTLQGMVDPDQHILPLCGTREGLFSAIFSAFERRSFDRQPAVLIPNPFYQTYAAAATAIGAELIFLDANEETGYLPDLNALNEDILRRTAVFYLCSPSNPQGAIADKDYLRRVITLARKYDFMLFSDECYSEIYFADPPPGALQIGHELGEGFSNIIAFNSLSKRSNLPGLRSGFVAGDAAFINDFGRFRNVACPQMPLPVQHASRATWRDEDHVIKNRALYAAKLDIADKILGKIPGFVRPQGGFFLWLDVTQSGGGEVISKTLWKECGVRVLPGAYLARESETHNNPGKNYIRIALVQDLPTTEVALKRIVKKVEL